jgi:hypothetical protein
MEKEPGGKKNKKKKDREGSEELFTPFFGVLRAVSAAELR